jgi:hypothetical protein
MSSSHGGNGGKIASSPELFGAIVAPAYSGTSIKAERVMACNGANLDVLSRSDKLEVAF